MRQKNKFDTIKLKLDNQYMKKNSLFLIIFSLVGILPLIGFAEKCEIDKNLNCPVTSIKDVMDILTKIVNYMYTAFFIVAIGFILLAAFNYLTAQDDPEKIKSATRQIMWAAVAIAVALISVGANKIIEEFLK